MLISEFIWVFFNEVIARKDNNPTKLSVIIYAYFQMLYNFGSLFDRYTIQSTDRVQPLPRYNELKEYLTSEYFRQIREDVLKEYLYIGHTAFLYQLYKTTPLKMVDYGIVSTGVKIDVTALTNWSISHLTGKSLELSRAGFSTKNTTGLPADYNPSSTSSIYWEQLIVPTGVEKGLNNLPVINSNNPLSFIIQNFLGKDYYLNNGFAVNPTNKIIDLSSKISKTWDTGLKEQMDLLLGVYANLDDNKKMIAELFAGSFSTVLPPPGFFIMLAMQLSYKYKQTIINDTKMYFMLAAGLFDASVSAWYYKSTFNQARPINLIRNNYTNTPITTWSPIAYGQPFTIINGNQWLPYQEFNFVTPPFPDVASGHTTFSRVAGKLLDWWFNNPILYDGFTLCEIPNCRILCPSLNNIAKSVNIGEFIFDKGTSSIEPEITPKKQVILRYKTIEELYLSAGISRIYGGIHSFQTNEVSAELADWVYSQTIDKLLKQFNYRRPIY